MAKACHGTWRHEAYVAHSALLDVPSARALLVDLEAAGYFERRESVFDEVVVEWQTTIAGAALVMASFLKPITRARAETLLEGVLTRAEAYNADKRKLFKIGRIQVFGSYLNPSVSHLGDLDLNVEVVGRKGDPAPDELLDYSEASGKNFATYVDWLMWPHREALSILRNRNGYINVHEEDISSYTDTWADVFPRHAEGTEDG